ncbi:MAG: pyrroline-5-carboxylate reductase [Deltaproteobacteria bacterium]|nr:pyrroline-5-carboxylate reductase [Deltaproteobacteria bacterium]
MLKGKRIGVIGGGKMGGVLIGGIIKNKLAAKDAVTVSDKDLARLQELEKQWGVSITEDNKKVARESDIIILSVKPQTMPNVLDDIKEALTKNKTVISIAAGISIKFMEARLKKGIHLIRAMPNTPALCGEGATALALGADATQKDLALARTIFDAVGLTVIVKEELLNAVTGLSGSGPAYGFIIVEALSDAGVLMGLPRDLALKLAAQTLLGAAKLCLAGDKHPGELKDMVTSPAGTTIAGVQALEDGALRATLIAAVQAAVLRAGELESGK